MSDPNKKTGQFVVRQRDTQVYSYIRSREDINKHKKEEVSLMTDSLATCVRVALILLSAVLTAYFIFESYPKQESSWLGFFALLPFFIAIRKTKTLWGALFYGLLTGFLSCVFLFYWIYYTCIAGGLTPGLSLGALCGLSLAVSLQFTVFAGMCFYARRYGYLYPLLTATGWVSVEFAHTLLAQYFLGFPWFILGYSQYANPLLIQSASFGGVFAVSFLLAFTSGALSAALTMRHNAERIVPLIMGAAVFGAFFIYGRDRLAEPLPMPKDFIKVSVLQPNIDQYKKWDAAFVSEIEQRLSAQLETAAQQTPDIIVWPETALPGPAQEERYMSWLEGVSLQNKAYQLVGSTLTVDDTNFVTAYLFGPGGDIDGIYNKEQLVPFGEYIPFEERLKNLDIEVLGALGSFTPGSAQQPLLKLYEIPIGTTICYEAVFSALWRKAARGGAKIFFNITNDGWYLDTSAPYQHFAANVLRAAEYGKPVVRSANTGISGWIDGKGRIKETSLLNTAAVMSFDVPVYDSEETFYSKRGDLFAYICMIIFLNISLCSFVASDE